MEASKQMYIEELWKVQKALERLPFFLKNFLGTWSQITTLRPLLCVSESDQVSQSESLYIEL
jgi:hypothetical protein